MTNDQIKAVFLANGFKEKDQGDGRMDLNPYVYDAARALLASVVVQLPPACPVPEEPEEAIDDSHMDAYHSANRMRKSCATAIEAAGVKAGGL